MVKMLTTSYLRLQGDHFTVRVGYVDDQSRKWVLPRSLLTSHSPYFAKMSPEKTESLLYAFEEAAFELFVQWLYLGELDLDGANISSQTLVTAWGLGTEFQCPAFRDHVMVQLIKSHQERGIEPRTLCRIFELVRSGPKLRKWAIAQFHAKITYGYTGYDDRKEDHPSDKDTWKKYAKNTKEFSQDFLGACLDASQGVKKPWEDGQQYMEVLRYAEIGVCKVEGRSMKVEATLTKAEGR